MNLQSPATAFDQWLRYGLAVKKIAGEESLYVIVDRLEKVFLTISDQEVGGLPHTSFGAIATWLKHSDGADVADVDRFAKYVFPVATRTDMQSLDMNEFIIMFLLCGYSSRCQSPPTPTLHKMRRQFMFRHYDKNRDGNLDRSEWDKLVSECADFPESDRPNSVTESMPITSVASCVSNVLMLVQSGENELVLNRVGRRHQRELLLEDFWAQSGRSITYDRFYEAFERNWFKYSRFLFKWALIENVCRRLQNRPDKLPGAPRPTQGIMPLIASATLTTTFAATEAAMTWLLPKVDQGVRALVAKANGLTNETSTDSRLATTTADSCTGPENEEVEERASFPIVEDTSTMQAERLSSSDIVGPLANVTATSLQVNSPAAPKVELPSEESGSVPATEVPTEEQRRDDFAPQRGEVRTPNEHISPLNSQRIPFSAAMRRSDKFQATVKRMCEQFLPFLVHGSSCGYPKISANDVLQYCGVVGQALAEDVQLVTLNLTEARRVVFVGELNGDVEKAQNTLRGVLSVAPLDSGMPILPPGIFLVFTGNILPNSTTKPKEPVLLLMLALWALKCRYSDQVLLLAGMTEKNDDINFYDRCVEEYGKSMGKSVWNCIYDAWEFASLGCFVADGFVYGGVYTSEVSLALKQINQLEKPLRLANEDAIKRSEALEKVRAVVLNSYSSRSEPKKYVWWRNDERSEPAGANDVLCRSHLRHLPHVRWLVQDQTISTVTDLNHRMWFDRLIMTRNDKAGWDLSIRRGPLTEEISFQEKCPGKSEPLKRDMAAVTTTDDDARNGGEFCEDLERFLQQTWSEKRKE